jgi:cyclic pyranopterin phosphate synthase
MPKEIFGPDFAFLPKAEVLSFEEIERVARAFVELGVEKLRITGGEPLVRRDLPVLISMLAALRRPDGGELDLTLTTNGSALRKLAPALRDAGLRRVTVSLDSLDDAVFSAMNGVDFPVAKVLDGIAAAQEAGLEPVKVNMVVRRGLNESSILPMARCASSSTWTSATRTAGGSTRSCRPTRSSRRSTPRWPSSGCPSGTAARSPAGGATSVRPTAPRSA